MTESTTSNEATLLVSALNTQRQHVLGILEGLSEAELHQGVLPTAWSCVGLVNHLALEVERFWFRRVVAGEQVDPNTASSTGASAWAVSPDVPAEEVLALYREEIELANKIVAGIALDAAPVWWPEDLFGNWRLHDLREVVVHVIAETACHAGHLDAVRELIDGRTWLRLT
jgi:uncharacterized damage-inducible protein DinB